MRKNGKKLLSLVLAMVMVLGMLPVTAQAIEASGKCGDSATYSLSSNGTLTISGTGATDDYFFEGKDMANWDKPSPFGVYASQIKRVVVEPGITRIGRGNFWFDDYANLTSVSFPNTLLEIGEYAFCGVPLTSVKLPDSLEKVGESAFSESGVVTVEVPSAQYGEEVFKDCEKLTTIKFSKANADSGIGWPAFQSCGALTTVTIPGYVKNLRMSMFEYCANLETVVLEEGVEEIGARAFNGCPSLTNIYMPQNSLKKIKNYAFPSAGNLATFVIPRSNPTVEQDAFYNCPLKNIVVPKEVTEMRGDTYSSCHDLTYLFIEGSERNFTYVDYPFPYGDRKLAQILNGDLGDIVYNFDISGFGFTSGCTSREPNISGSGTSGNTETGKPGDATATCTVKFDANGGSGFMNSKSVESGSSYTLPSCTFTPPPGKEFKAWNINGTEYAPGKSLKVTGQNGSTLAVKAVWKDAAKTTGVIAFDANGGSGFMASKTLNTGEAFALPACSFTPPTGKVFKAWSIDGKEYAPNASITVKAGTTTVKALWKDGGGNTSATSGYFGDGLTWELAYSTLTIRGRGSMPDFSSTSNLPPWNELKDKIEKVILEEGVYNIGSWAFAGCIWLASVEIPDTVVFIGDCAFYRCGRLGSIGAVKIPDSVTFMVGNPFDGCHENLTLEYSGSKEGFEEITSNFFSWDKIKVTYGKQSGPQQSGPSVSKNFSDVKASAYYFDSVQWAVQNGITAGTGATTFSPDKTCTTAEILTFLWRASGSPTPMSRSSFRDIKPSDFYYKAALWAKQNEMVTGGAFNGDTPCTRSATVTYLWILSGRPSIGSASKFTDVSGNADYAAAVAWAVDRGITAGTSAATFSPDTTCTRAEIATFLYRAYK